MFETPEELVVIAAMPGAEPEDIALRLEGGTLYFASSERGADAGKKYLSKEWSYGPYSRQIHLPACVDATRANVMYGNGVLTIVLPKAAAFADADLEVPKVKRARGLRAGHGG
jgi:HSP20 family protein